MVFDYPVWSSLNVGQLLDCSHSFLALKLHVSENDTPFLNSLGRLLIWAFQYSQCTTHQCSFISSRSTYRQLKRSKSIRFSANGFFSLPDV
jgi:hypothetical protein